MGYKFYHDGYGIVHADHSHGLGIPFFTTDETGVSLITTDGTNLMTSAKCVVFNRQLNTAKEVAPCPETVGVCRNKIG